MADVIGFIISAKNEASAVLKTVSRDMKALEKSNKNASDMDKLAVGIGSVVTAGAGLAVLYQGADAINEMARAGAQFERLSGSFNSLASSYGTSGSAILSAVDAVTQGTLSQQTIMQQANNAMLLGVADTADEFSTLAKIAQVRGRAMGISMEFAFESIVKGVGRLSPLILDNLGIVINADQTYAKYAATLGVASEALTEAQRRQALLNALKSEVANWDASSVLDNASAWERWGVAIDNARVRIGAFLNSNSETVGLLNEVTEALNFFSTGFGNTTADQVEHMTMQIDKYKEKINELVAANNLIKGSDYWLNDLRDWAGTIDRNNAQIADLQSKIRSLNGDMKDVALASQYAGGSMSFLAVGSKNAAQEMAWLDAQLALVSDQTERYAKAAGVSSDAAKGWAGAVIMSTGSAQNAVPVLNQVVAAFEAAAQRIAAVNNLIAGSISSLGSIGAQAYANSGYNPEVLTMIGDAEIAMKGMTSSLHDSGYEGAQLNAIMGQVESEVYGGLNAINEMAAATNKASGASGGGGAKQLTKEFQELHSIVSGLLNGAFEDIGGVKVEDFLPRQDAINEPARRIASVMVEGFDSEWVDYFKNSFPILWQEYMGRSGGDVKNAAALLLKDFQNGMRPELIDKGRMKEIAKQMFFVDQSTKALIDEVAKEMAAELGITVEEATGYAGGASGSSGGGGLLKKIVSPEEVEKIKKLLNFKPTWDFGAGGEGGGNGIIEAGKKAGVLSEDGSFAVKVKLVTDPTTFASILENPLGVTVRVTTIDFNKSGLEKFIGDTFGPLAVTVQPTLGANGEGGTNPAMAALQADISATKITATISPSINYTAWEEYKTSATGMLNEIVFLPKIVATEDEMKATTAIFKQAVASSITDQDYLSAIIAQWFTGFSTALSDQITSFQVLGLVVGSYMYQGFSQYNLGLILASELSRQLTEAKATFEASAGSAGKMWGTAFLKTVGENVPFELLMILTDLVTPEVIQRVKDGESRGKSE